MYTTIHPFSGCMMQVSQKGFSSVLKETGTVFVRDCPFLVVFAQMLSSLSRRVLVSTSGIYQDHRGSRGAP